ncbi:MAG: hypothetical protein AAF694_19530 [Bacteroidota bacterium]
MKYPLILLVLLLFISCHQQNTNYLSQNGEKAGFVKTIPQDSVFSGIEGFDPYGGYLSIKGKATGHFHLDTLNGRHYLITPAGHGFISIGVTHTIGLKNERQSRYHYLEESLNGDWDKASVEIQTYFRQWGYNTLGYGSHKSTRKLLPYFAGCQPTKVSAWLGKNVVYPDVFSEEWKEEARQILEKTIEEYGITSNLIGIYWTDIPLWDLNQAKRKLGKTWVDAIRELPQHAAGKIKYEQFLSKNGSNASDEDFLVLIAREVYSFLGPLTRKLAPNTLIFGERYAGWALPWSVIQEALPYIDVVSIQPPSSAVYPKNFERLYRETGKPIMVCDHNIGFNTPEHSNVMWKTLGNVDSVGLAYERYLKEGFSRPYLLGYNKCQYIDRFLVDQKILKQGLLQVDGKPYEELVDWVEKVNWHIHDQFITLSK